MSFTCSRDSLADLAKRREKVLVMFAQDGCEPCNYYHEVIKEADSKLGSLEIAKIDLSKGERSCHTLADEMKVEGTPTLVYYERGVMKEQFYPVGDKAKDVEKLVSLAASPETGQAAPQSSPAASSSTQPTPS